MKKLMIAAAAVALASVVNAATVTWNASILESNADWGYPVGNVVLATGSQSWKLSDFVEGYSTGTITGDSDGIFKGGTAWTATIVATLLSFDGVDTYTPAGEFTKTIDFVMPAGLSGDGPSDGQKLTALNDEISMAFADPNLGTLPLAVDAPSQDWTAVPEPTSGLLLLLGVAGLALKRKRA